MSEVKQHYTWHHCHTAMAQGLRAYDRYAHRPRKHACFKHPFRFKGSAMSLKVLAAGRRKVIDLLGYLRQDLQRRKSPSRVMITRAQFWLGSVASVWLRYRCSRCRKVLHHYIDKNIFRLCWDDQIWKSRSRIQRIAAQASSGGLMCLNSQCPPDCIVCSISSHYHVPSLPE